MRATFLSSFGFAAVLLAFTGTASGQPHLMGTTFTYQGQLKDGGGPVSDACDFIFSLWDDAAGGTKQGSDIPISTSVDEGLFTVNLDFGAQYNGQARWLEMEVCCPSGSCTLETLIPRTELTPAPHALALPGLYTQQNAVTEAPNVIGGHADNEVAPGVIGATISGGGETGFVNRVTHEYSTVGGGRDNEALNHDVTIGGGWGNEVTGGASTISGGQWNSAGGQHATVPGGFRNRADGLYSFAAGRKAKADHDGTLVWADSTDADFISTGPDQFLIRAGGGVGVNTDAPGAALHIGGTPAVDGLMFPDGTLQTTAAVGSGGGTIGGNGTVYVDIDAQSSETVLSVGFSSVLALPPIVTVAGATNGGDPAHLIPHAVNVTTSGFDLVLANTLAGQHVQGIYGFNWIALEASAAAHTWYRDLDGDGYSDGTTLTQPGTAPPGFYDAGELYATTGDCDDNDEFMNPDETEVCDGKDNNCNGNTDEGAGGNPCPLSEGVCAGTLTTCVEGAEVCDYGLDYEDPEVSCDTIDNDCDGEVDEGFDVGTACGTGVCAGGQMECEPDGTDTQCDTGPGGSYDQSSSEVCDGLDNDCDGEVDGEGTGGNPCPLSGEGVCGETETTCVEGEEVCDYGPHFEDPEVSCDGLDNNCDGEVDEGC